MKTIDEKLRGHLPGAVKMSHVTETCDLCQFGSALAAERAARKAAESAVELVREEYSRDMARLKEKVARLRVFAHWCSLDEHESTSSASDKVRSHGRKARAVLKETE